VSTFTLEPTERGIPRATLADLKGGDASENATITRGILQGEIHGPKRDAVILNAGAALSTDCGDWNAGLDEARASIDSGAALRVLDAFVAKSQSFVK
jgi:anthranilate phosphoribosyltransferase